MYHILIVEDEIKIAETVIEYLKRDGYSVRHAATVADALATLNPDTDLVILDLMLPDGKGEEVCEIAVNTYNIPVIMLTAKNAEQSRIAGFAYGADDYLTKPFSPRELVARVKAVLKRTKPTEEAIELAPGIVIYPAKRVVTKSGADIRLTPNEYKILSCLTTNRNKIVSREKLIEYIDSADSFDRTVDVHVRHLRQKLEEDSANPQIIKTVHGSGYILGDKKPNAKK